MKYCFNGKDGKTIKATLPVVLNTVFLPLHWQCWDPAPPHLSHTELPHCTPSLFYFYRFCRLSTKSKWLYNSISQFCGKKALSWFLILTTNTTSLSSFLTFLLTPAPPMLHDFMFCMYLSRAASLDWTQQSVCLISWADLKRTKKKYNIRITAA